ncbi:hypothetical protein ACQKWADRAFT_81235 [Trichoderma austrokoningii]
MGHLSEWLLAATFLFAGKFMLVCGVSQAQDSRWHSESMDSANIITAAAAQIGGGEDIPWQKIGAQGNNEILQVHLLPLDEVFS